MGVKFEVDAFLKSRGECCDFLKVLECTEDTGESAHIKVIFYTQLDKGWKQMSNSFWLRISTRDYDNWRAYSPRGSLEE